MSRARCSRLLRAGWILSLSVLVAACAWPAVGGGASVSSAATPCGAGAAGRRVVVVKPEGSLRKAVDANPAGTTFCLAAGVHRLRDYVVPKANDVFLGERGAVLSGAKDITGVFTRSGSYWVAAGQTQRNTATAGLCLAAAPNCIAADDVYYDDKPLRRAASLGDLRPGRFFFDYDEAKIWIASDPAGHRVEAAVATRAFKGWGSGAAGVTIRGLVIEKFANEGGIGAINATTGWKIERNEVRLNHGVGIQGGVLVRDNNVHDNGQLGLSIYGDTNITVSGNRIANNNYAGYDTNWEAGGVKMIRTTQLRVTRNRVTGNRGPGLWFDTDNRDVLVDRNTVIGNTGPGILYETSYRATIRRNTLRANGFALPGGLDGGGIVVNTSTGVEIAFNDVSRNFNGIGLTAWDRGSGRYGRFALRDVDVHDNKIVMIARSATGLVSHDIADYVDGNIRFRRNHYVLCRPAFFAWRDPSSGALYAYVQKTDWVRAGHDADGRFEWRC